MLSRLLSVICLSLGLSMPVVAASDQVWTGFNWDNRNVIKVVSRSKDVVKAESHLYLSGKEITTIRREFIIDCPNTIVVSTKVFKENIHQTYKAEGNLWYKEHQGNRTYDETGIADVYNFACLGEIPEGGKKF